jgi:outer membrane protein
MKRIVFSVIAIIVCVSVHAQDGTRKPLTFKEAVKLGLQHNVLLTQQRNQLEYTQVNKTATLLQMGPSVNASAEFYRTDGNSFNQNVGQVVNGVIDYVGGNISANMPVFNGLAFLNQHRAAVNANEAQLHQVVRSNQDVIATVANQYLTCLLDRELVRVNAENVKTQQATYDQIKEQVALGGRAAADEYTQEYQLRNAELLLVQAETTFKNDLALMSVTLGIDPVSFDVVDINWDINKAFADTTTLEYMRQNAMDRRSDLKQALYAEKAFRHSFSAAKGRYYPSIYAGANYGSRYNYVQGEENRSFDNQFYSDNTRLNYGFSLTIPIWNAWQNKSQATLARVAYKNASIRRENTEVVVKSDVQRAYENFNGAKTSFKAAQSGVKAAELSYQVEKERYDLGASNIVQLATVNVAYVRAQGDFARATFNLMFQRVLMAYAEGTLKFEDIPD